MRLLLSLLVLSLLVPASQARAENTGLQSNQPLFVLDSIATEVSGKPQSVHCESEELEWRRITSAVTSFDPALVTAWTQPARPVIYLSPRACHALRTSYEYDLETAGVREFALSLLALAHEGIHQKGVTNEAETECQAVPLVKPLAIKYFKIPAKTAKFTPTKIRGIRTYRKTLVDNPVFDKLGFWVNYWKSIKPPAYQGAC